MNIKVLNELYEKYGFKKRESFTEAIVYTYSVGYFHNAEIIKMKEEYDCSNIIKEYQDLGYSCKSIYYQNIDEVHERLFKGFFNFDLTKERLYNDYNKYCESQTKQLTYKYSYINCPYYHNGIEQTESLIDRIVNITNSQGVHLIILEAAAGYGKTCTSYELLKEIITLADNNKIPILTELSRNRTATIFKYVLLDEIDKYFHSLKSNLVISEIAEGRIPLIIDGFDELISKANQTDKVVNLTKDKDVFEDAESMLDTIGDLLQGNAKIILTSRKSAMFTGEKFEQWISTRDNKFSITRFVLGEPSIKHWLGQRRVEILKEKSIPFSKLANPVLLAFLKNLSDENFYEYSSDTEKVIQKYFETLLEREKERQNVVFTVEEQLGIYKCLALEMVDLNITAENREFIKDIIIDKQKDLINSVRSRYPSSNRPDSEDIAYTLARHVLLDRIGIGINNKIGFVNDFVFGILIGEGICDYHDDWIGDTKYIDLACTAFSIRSEEKRNNLYKKLGIAYELLYPQEQLEVDIKLMYRLTKSFSQSDFYSLNFKEFDFVNGYELTECTFTQCEFNGVKLKKSSFNSCAFFDCIFYDCEFINDINNDRNLLFSNCSGQSVHEFAATTQIISTPEDEKYFERLVLEQYWPKGRANAQPTRTYRTLFSGITTKQYVEVEGAISRLRKEGILEKHGELVYLKYECMKEIRDILGICEGE